MTTIGAPNCCAIAVDGTFDDCQSMVKAMFSHGEFRDRVCLSAVNSINWGRVMAQVVYYFTFAVSLGAPEHTISFTVPTGNFGDVYAGFVARQMGLPIDRLVIATNENDILTRTLGTGEHRLSIPKATITPSMDIQISSNFERLLFDTSGRDASVVRTLMQELSDSGRYVLPPQALAYMASAFDAGTASEAETLAQIARTNADTGYLCDPHTAVALHVARQHTRPDVPMVTLCTAHPVKFPDAVSEATGRVPSPPPWADTAEGRNEVVTQLDNDVDSVEEFILARSRVGSSPIAEGVLL